MAAVPDVTCLGKSRLGALWCTITRYGHYPLNGETHPEIVRLSNYQQGSEDIRRIIGCAENQMSV